MIVSIFHHLAGQSDILSKGLGGCVDHHRGEAVVNAALAQLKAVAMIQVQADWQTRFNDGGLHQLHQIGAVGISPGALGHLQNHRGIELGGGAGDTLNDLHIVYIECTDGVAALIGLFEHFLRSNQWHRYISFSINFKTLI